MVKWLWKKRESSQMLYTGVEMFLILCLLFCELGFQTTYISLYPYVYLVNSTECLSPNAIFFYHIHFLSR